ncbi:copine domain protein atypical [Anaeramoeba ignava]|uniref:Copine domain protein atypical n=1 Tax=Anaeramoeba ignava TaxID=1746090 RepID=A0A9Q0LHU9_ANAIG|nr:copine domain protein atypical [Anaeramoeba ignava]|eukprot:Anaeramoba_ignava/a488984_93.p1 GENE.a488984_93~~a488984_93.p1  ORF type:complete len:561 (+),score=195.56 a488984_93:85-1767(+)
MITQTQISAICRDLKKEIPQNKSLVACLLIFDPSKNKWEEHSKVNLLAKGNSLEFENPLKIDFIFGEDQRFNLIIVIDDLLKERRKIFGSIPFSLLEIITKKELKVLTKILDKQSEIGSAEITVTELPPKGHAEKVEIKIPPLPPEDQQIEDKHYFLKDAQKKVRTFVGLRVKIHGEGLEKKDRFGKTDPYLKIFFKKEGDWKLVHQTEHILKTLDPSWNEFNLLGKTEDFKINMRVCCYDWDKVGKHDLVGEFETRFRRVLTKDNKFTLINPKKQKKKKYTNSGYIVFDYVKKQYEEQIHTIKVKENFPPLIPFTEYAPVIEYFRAGFDLKPIFCVDLTSIQSDGGIHSKQYREKMTAFQFVLHTTSTLLNPFNQSGTISTFKLPLKDKPLPLGDNLELNPDQILGTYNNIVSKKKIEAGKTEVTPLIEYAVNYLHGLRNRNTYATLLILLESDPSDYNNAIDALVRASQKPLSVVFVGIGENFTHKFEQKDFDNKDLKRKCFSFFQISKHQSSLGSEIQNYIKQSTGKPIIKEDVPYIHFLSSLSDQIIEFMRMFRKD